MRQAFLALYFFTVTVTVANASKFADTKKDAHPTSFLISNDSGTDKDISLNGSGGFFADLKEMITFINKKYESSAFPYDYQKAWRFMVDFTWAARLPLTHLEWYHNPLTFINSTGWGLCDDKAIVLAKIWMAMGYKSRVYYLKGHVVPEILVHDHWEMWDPTFHVFYKDSANNILGVEDLFKDNAPVRVNNYDTRITQSFWAKRMGFSKRTAQLYELSNKRSVYIPIADTVHYNYAHFLLPKGSFVVFPVYNEYPLKSTSYNKTKNQKDYAQLMLYLAPRWTGVIKYPLVFHALTSSEAEVSIDKRKYVLNNKNKTIVNEEFCSRSTIEITHNEKGISFFFLINPRLFNRLDNFGNIKQILMSGNIYIHIIELPLKQKHHINYLNEVEKNKWLTYLKIIEYFLKN